MIKIHFFIIQLFLNYSIFRFLFNVKKLKIQTLIQASQMGETQNLHLPLRNRSSLKKPLLVVLLVCITSVILVCTYMYPQHNSKSSACKGLSSRGCEAALSGWLPVHVRKFTDEEVAARVVIKDILRTPPVLNAKSKIAFLFLTPGTLPFEKLWDKFFQVSMILKHSWFL